jgi:hypothetical protein
MKFSLDIVYRRKPNSTEFEIESETTHVIEGPDVIEVEAKDKPTPRLEAKVTNPAKEGTE